MRLLTATHATQGDRDDDFDHGTTPGEIVEPVMVCDRDLDDNATPCGCGRAFVGLSSGNTGTSAVVADVEVTRRELLALLANAHPHAGRRDRRGMANHLAEYGAEYPPGTVVGIWRYALHER